MIRSIAGLCAMFAAGPAVAQVPLPFSQELEATMDAAAEKAGWASSDVKRGFGVAAKDGAFGLPLTVEAGTDYLFVASCAKPCTKVGLALETPEEDGLSDLVWSKDGSDVPVVTTELTDISGAMKLVGVAVIAECLDDTTCPGGVSVYATRSK